MAYVGPPSDNSYTSFDKQTITGNGGQTYTLSRSVTSSEDIEVFVNNVRQEPGVAYTASGTSLNMTGNVASTDSFYLVYQGKALQTKSVPANSVGTNNLVANAVTSSHIAANAVSSANIQSNAITTAKLHDDAVTSAKLPAGTLVKTTVFPVINQLSVANPASYNNTRGNYRDLGSAYHQDVTVVTDNPILIVTGAIGVYGQGGSHTYFDFWVTGTSITDNWISLLMGGSSTCDGIATNHMGTNSDDHPFPIHAAWSTSLSAGDTVSIRPYVASWSSNTIHINQYVGQVNRNMDMVTRFICQEIST